MTKYTLVEVRVTNKSYKYLYIAHVCNVIYFSDRFKRGMMQNYQRKKEIKSIRLMAHKQQLCLRVHPQYLIYIIENVKKQEQTYMKGFIFKPTHELSYWVYFGKK